MCARKWMGSYILHSVPYTGTGVCRRLTILPGQLFSSPMTLQRLFEIISIVKHFSLVHNPSRYVLMASLNRQRLCMLQLHSHHRLLH